MNTLGIIPARYASTRFPGKPLVDIAGKSMLQRVYEQAKKTPTLSEVIIATDDQRIVDHVLAFGGNVELTDSAHQSGTDRAAEVAQRHPQFEVIINIQGDEPFIQPEQIALLTGCFSTPVVQIATLIKQIKNSEELHNPNLPKVAIGHDQRAVYFSRSPIPYLRGIAAEKWLSVQPFYKHIGLYGYRRDTLMQLTQLRPTVLEQTESLEQLRWLDYGYVIYTAETHLETIAIDTPEDLEKALAHLS